MTGLHRPALAVAMIRRTLRIGAAAGALLIILVAVPWALARLDRLVLPEMDWHGLATQPMTAPSVVLAATAAGWVLWAWLLSVVARDGIDRLRRRTMTRRRLPVPMHQAVSTLTGAAVLISDSITGHATQPPQVPANPSPAAAPVTATPPPQTTPRPPGAPSATASDRSYDVDYEVNFEGRLDVVSSVAERAVDERGVSFSGGWLPLPAAAGIGAAVALLWAHRRRLYRPRPPGPAGRHDPDLSPTPPMLARLRERVDTADLEDTALADAEVPAMTLGAAAERWLALTDLPTGGLHLTGPGALDAARALLATVLTANLVTPGGSPTLVTTVGDLQTLLGDADAATGLPGLRLAADLTDAITLARQAANRSHDAATPGHVVVLHTLPVISAAEQVLRDLVAAADGSVVAVFTGPGSPGRPWIVEADGIVGHVPAGPSNMAGRTRLGMLNQFAARTVVNTLHQVRLAATPSSGRMAEAVNAVAGNHAIAGQPNGRRIPTRVVVRVLGRIQVLVPQPDGSLHPVHIERRASRQILLCLALHRNGVSTSDLKEAIWPDTPNTLATRSFTVNLSALRGHLQTADGATAVQSDTIRRAPTQSMHRLDPDLVDVDLWQLHDLLDDAAAAADPAERTALLRQVVEFDIGDCGGSLGGGIASDWLSPHREATSRHLIDTYSHLADTESDHRIALALLHQAVRLAPHNEQLYQAIMRRQMAAADVASACRTLATVTERLAELHLEPSPDTRSLAAVIARHTQQPIRSDTTGP